jgi:hypothetical protein
MIFNFPVHRALTIQEQFAKKIIPLSATAPSPTLLPNKIQQPPKISDAAAEVKLPAANNSQNEFWNKNKTVIIIVGTITVIIAAYYIYDKLISKKITVPVQSQTVKEEEKKEKTGEPAAVAV